jgi:hypothetical protein
MSWILWNRLLARKIYPTCSAVRNFGHDFLAWRLLIGSSLCLLT